MLPEGKEHLDLYKEVFEENCWKHPLYAEASYYMLLAQMPNIKKNLITYTSHYIDLRIHLCYLAPSGTGKGAGARFISQVAKDIGLKFQAVSEITDAGLVGRIVKDRIYNPVTKTTSMANMIERGFLDPATGINILFSGEAETLLRSPSPYTTQVLNLLQIAMNPMGSEDNRIVKKLAVDYPIDIQPTCSIFLTSYPPPMLWQILTERGLLQRMLFIPIQFTPEEIKEITMLAMSKIDLTGTDTSIKEKYNMLISGFKEINDFYETNLTPHIRDDAVKNKLKELVAVFYERVFNTIPMVRTQLEKFVQRYMEYLIKLSFLHAFSRKSASVEMIDLETAYIFIQKIWVSIISFFEFSYKKSQDEVFAETRWKSLLYTIFPRTDIGLVENDIIRKIVSSLQVSVEASTRIMSYWKERNWIYKKEDFYYRNQDI